MAQFSTLCKESSQGQNALNYLFKVHTFARFKFTCSVKSSFMELVLCLCLSLKVKKKNQQPTIPLSTVSFSHAALPTINLNVYSFFPLDLVRNYFEFYCSVTLSNDDKQQREYKIKEASISLRTSKHEVS